MHPSQQHAYPGYSPMPPPPQQHRYPAYSSPSLQQHEYPGYPAHPSQYRRPPAYSRHLPSSDAVTEETESEAYADDYPGAFPDFPPPEEKYPPPPPASAGEVDYHRGERPPSDYPLEAAAYPVVGVLPSHGQYPGMQQPMYQSFLQPPILQLPVYSIGHIYPPQYQPQYPPQYLPQYSPQYPPQYAPQYVPQYSAAQYESLYQTQLAADQQLLQYTEVPTSVDSNCPGLLELPTKGKDESEAVAVAVADDSTLPSHTMSLADTTRKLDEILGKRADQRTEEEKKFREDHLAARQSVHTRDAIDRDRRRQRKLIS
jgi:hypothetical protein